MKVAILAGGAGTRLAEETEIRPKPMVEIGGRPIMWHIMMHYAQYGFDEFVVALGYKGEYIKKWFKDYCSLALEDHVTFKTGTGQVKIHGNRTPDWTVDLVETGVDTLTGGRIKQLASWVGTQTFMLTWGDGVSNVNLHRLLEFHRSHGRLATMTAVRPPARYGHLQFDGDQVTRFTEKSQTAEGWINGAFFVLERPVFDYIAGDDIMWEDEPLERLAADGQLMAYRHTGFWQCMDTLREKHLLERLWQSKQAPWKTWE
jgi:glucose-1-phosphate cytidylyltransferase